MAAQDISPDVKALKVKRNEIENSICDLFKDANNILSARTFSGNEELNAICKIQRVCLLMLQSYLN